MFVARAAPAVAKAERSKSARKGWKTRDARVREGMMTLTQRWGDALQRARQTGRKRDWQALRAIDVERADVIESAEKHRRWKRIIRSVAEQAADVFDVDPDTLLT